MSHFGIDPRKRLAPNITKPTRAKYNPYLVTQPNKRLRSSLEAKQALPSLESPKERNTAAFDKMLAALATQPMHVAIETMARELLHASSCLFWASNGTHFFSTSTNKKGTMQDGIVGKCLLQKKLLPVTNLSSDIAYNNGIDSAIGTDISHCLFIPLQYPDGKAFGVIQAGRRTGEAPFLHAETETADFLMEKFKVYSHILTRPLLNTKFLSTIVQANTNDFMQELLRRYKANTVELWMFDSATGTYFRYDAATNEMLEVDKRTVGTISHAFNLEEPIIIQDVTKSQHYDPAFDGSSQMAVLMQSVSAEQHYALAIRRKAEFNYYEASQLSSLIPLIPQVVNDSNRNANFAVRLKALLEVAEILSGVLDLDVLIPTIMDKSCALLNAERCSLFLVDATNQELVTRFHGGLNKSIRIPMNRGIVGHTATTGQCLTIKDVYDDNRFDRSVDIKTGYRTKSIMTVPIYNNRGEIAGVTEMINTIGRESFDAEDMKMMMAFNVFCGISLDNAKLYEASLSLTHQLRGFVELSAALNQTRTVKDIIEEILANAQGIVHASRATIFLSDYTPFVTIGETLNYGDTFAKQCDETLKVFSREEVMILTSDTEVEIPSASPLSRVTSVLSSSNDVVFSDGNGQFESICCIPLFTGDKKFTGIMELSSPSKILPEDIKLLDCYAVFASVTMERSQLKELAELGQTEVELKRLIEDAERKEFTIPEKLQLSPEEFETIKSIRFDSPEWDGDGHFKVIWAIFNELELNTTYKITNEKLFRFLHELKHTYKKVPYHNWRHAVDVTQFVFYQLKLCNLDKTLTKFEMLGMIVSALCHDANHDGFTNTFNEKAETPLGILFKNQSVMETHHCSVAIRIISKPDCNIFSELESADYKKMWVMIISLILATDMAKHFTTISSVKKLIEDKVFTNEDDEHRLLGLELILKCADISNVSRPFEMADKWSDVLCEEFFRQGDLEMTHGMEYTSPLNDRAHLDKPKSQIGFYNFVCLPLFETVVMVYPPLQANVDQIRSNLAVWTSRSEAAAKAEAEAAAAAEAAAKNEAPSTEAGDSPPEENSAKE